MQLSNNQIYETDLIGQKSKVEVTMSLQSKLTSEFDVVVDFI